MGRIRSKDTVPEMVIRRLVHGLGYRYRLHSGKLPGHPDLTFAGRKKVIFVHGCFWHQHEGCRKGRLPKSKLDYWKPKLKENAARDRRNIEKLISLGWNVLVIWECEMKNMDEVKNQVVKFLGKKL